MFYCTRQICFRLHEWGVERTPREVFNVCAQLVQEEDSVSYVLAAQALLDMGAADMVEFFLMKEEEVQNEA